MRAALLQVKEELGADAVIMSNKKVAGGVEIVAAVDGDHSAGRQMSNDYSSRPRQAQYAQPPAAPAASPRQLEDDRVSLQSSADKGRSMTQRFANMLKQYSHHEQEDQPPAERGEDSLTALLRRQQEKRNDGSLSGMLKEDSPLARLIADDPRMHIPYSVTPKIPNNCYAVSPMTLLSGYAEEELHKAVSGSVPVDRLGKIDSQPKRQHPKHKVRVKRVLVI